jgi:type I restriction enzyme S subunit
MGDMFKVKHGFAFDGKYFASEGEYVLLSPGNFHDAGGFKFKDKEKYFTGDIPEDYVLSEGDLLVAMTEQAEGLLGSSALIPSSNRFLHNQRLGLITDWKATAIDLRFLYYLFNTREARAQIRASATGTKVRHTSPTRIGEVRVVIPRVETQRKIASALSAYDDLIENNTRRIAILEEMAQSLYREWFVEYRFPGHEKARFIDSPLGKIPAGWEVKRLKDLCERITSGGTPTTSKSEFWGGGIPWLSSGETGNAFIIRTDKTITEQGVSGSSTRLVRKGSTVIASAGQGKTRGQTSLLRIDCYVNQSVIALTADGKLSSDTYLFCDLSRRYDQFRQISDGSSRGSLTTQLLADLEVISPKGGLVHEFEDLVAPVFQAIECLLLKNLVLRITRDLLLPKLMSGQVDVEDLDIDIGESLAEADA